MPCLYNSSHKDCLQNLLLCLRFLFVGKKILTTVEISLQFFSYIKKENCSGISKLPDGIGDDGLYVKDLTCRSKREHAVKFHLGCVQLCLN